MFFNLNCQTIIWFLKKRVFSTTIVWQLFVFLKNNCFSTKIVWQLFDRLKTFIFSNQSCPTILGFIKNLRFFQHTLIVGVFFLMVSHILHFYFLGFVSAFFGFRSGFLGTVIVRDFGCWGLLGGRCCWGGFRDVGISVIRWSASDCRW